VEQETYCVDKNVPLLALDLLARIVAVRINARPIFCECGKIPAAHTNLSTCSLLASAEIV
jgi:hypothetical protein